MEKTCHPESQEKSRGCRERRARSAELRGSRLSAGAWLCKAGRQASWGDSSPWKKILLSCREGCRGRESRRGAITKSYQTQAPADALGSRTGESVL